ncbi:glycosyltransferase family 8 protein [Arcticibacter eurypsychrophilus]|uniref:glycosyltransferase family 8 protein n=1 Tax=Arcticibacter eurypsychrophilus TaxID=1434752 RepID=UPI00084DEC61|nr:glycosyltransferase family 8 protein [Arcticibacter eurypsychrophilus]
MEESAEKITVVTVCDNHYAVLLAALLKSIEVNYKADSAINLYIVEDGLIKQNKDKIIGSVSKDVFHIYWLKLSEIIPDKSNLPLDASSFPLNVYARLFIPHFISPLLEKVIYLDVDMIMEEDIQELWKIDLQDKVIGGVVDRSGVVSSTWGGISNYKELGLSPDTKYFNSGLLILNPKKWRELNCTERILKCVNENKKYTNFPDQYGLNVVFADQWLQLDSKWNCYAVSKEPNPYLIHFIGIKPIYSSYAYNEDYKNRFYHYLQLTQWNGFKPHNSYKRLLKKLYNKLIKKGYEFFSKKSGS